MKPFMRIISTAGLAIALLSSLAAAKDEGDSEQQIDKPFSITVAPVYLLGPVLQVTGEYGFAHHLSAAAIVAAGSVSFPDDGGDWSGYDLGAQFRYYTQTDPRGFQLGAQVLWAHASSDNFLENDSRSGGDALTAGPFLGYKFVASNGLTVDFQAGYGFLWVLAWASTTYESVDANVNAGLPIVNLNLGWSF